MSTYTREISALFGANLTGQASPASNVSYTVRDQNGAVLIAATSGTNDVQTITISGSPTGGSFTLTLTARGQTLTTAAIAYNATPAQVASALQALANCGAQGVICTGTQLPGGSVACTFAGPLANQPIGAMGHTGDSFTGGTTPASSVTHTTTGVQGVQEADGAQGWYKAQATFTDTWCGTIEWAIAGQTAIALEEFGPRPIDFTQAIPSAPSQGTVGDALLAAEAQGVGKWALSGTTLTLYRHDGTTVVRTFTLDSATAPTQRS